MNPINKLRLYVTNLRQFVRFDPTRDWFVLRAFFVAVLTWIIAWNGWAFEIVSSGGIIGSERKEVTAPTFDSKSLEAVRAVLDARSAEESKYKTGEYRFIDPSQ